MTFFTASFETVLLRYFLMMTVVVASFSLGYPAFAILGLPIFITGIAAISFKSKNKQVKQQALIEKTLEKRQINTAA